MTLAEYIRHRDCVVLHVRHRDGTIQHIPTGHPCAGQAAFMQVEGGVDRFGEWHSWGTEPTAHAAENLTWWCDLGQELDKNPANWADLEAHARAERESREAAVRAGFSVGAWEPATC